MGFLDRVKASFSQTVGGKTALHLELDTMTAAPGATIPYRLVLVTSGPLQAARVTVGLYGCERVRVWLGTSSSGALGPAAGGPNEAAPLASAAARETVTYQVIDPVVPGELALPTGQTREYAGALLVPDDAQPTYRGRDAQHTWWVRAIVEIPLGIDQIEESEVMIR